MNNSNLKIILLGDGRVGKTSIINKYMSGQFNESEKMTTNFAFVEKQITFENQKYNINIWDTAGQENFNALTPIYYRDAKGVILVYDITNPNSFTRVTKWVEELAQYNKEAQMIFVGNKIDTNDWKIDQKESVAYAKLHNSHHFFASAKSGMNINAIFEHMSTALIKQAQKNKPKSNNNSQTSNKLEVARDNNQQKSKGCC